MPACIETTAVRVLDFVPFAVVDGLAYVSVAAGTTKCARRPRCLSRSRISRASLSLSSTSRTRRSESGPLFSSKKKSVV